MPLARWNRLLAGIAACLGGLWLAMVPARGQDSPAAAAADTPIPICNERFFWYITKLAARYLNNHVPLPAAFQIFSATLDDSGSARFRIYALTEDPRFYCDATSLFTLNPRQRQQRVPLTLNIHPAPPLTRETGAVRLVDDPTGPYVSYTPWRRWGPRRETLTFTLHITRPNSGNYSANFKLTVPGLAGTGAALR